MKLPRASWPFEVLLHRKHLPLKSRKYLSFEAAIRKTAERCISASPRDLFEIVHADTSIQLATAKVKVGGLVEFVFNEKE